MLSILLSLLVYSPFVSSTACRYGIMGCPVSGFNSLGPRVTSKPGSRVENSTTGPQSSCYYLSFVQVMTWSRTQCRTFLFLIAMSPCTPKFVPEEHSGTSKIRFLCCLVDNVCVCTALDLLFSSHWAISRLTLPCSICIMSQRRWRICRPRRFA